MGYLWSKKWSKDDFLMGTYWPVHPLFPSGLVIHLKFSIWNLFLEMSLMSHNKWVINTVIDYIGGMDSIDWKEVEFILDVKF